MGEYVGEVLDAKMFRKRAKDYARADVQHFYFMALSSEYCIDASEKGNVSRFINHSCNPNAETQKWMVNGEMRVGFFTKTKVFKGEEITFDYKYERYGQEAQKCCCDSENCRGWLGGDPSAKKNINEIDSEGGEDWSTSMSEDEEMSLNYPPKQLNSIIPILTLEKLDTQSIMELQSHIKVSSNEVEKKKLFPKKMKLQKSPRKIKNYDVVEYEDQDEIEKLRLSGI